MCAPPTVLFIRTPPNTAGTPERHIRGHRAVSRVPHRWESQHELRDGEGVPGVRQRRRVPAARLLPVLGVASERAAEGPQGRRRDRCLVGERHGEGVPACRPADGGGGGDGDDAYAAATSRGVARPDVYTAPCGRPAVEEGEGPNLRCRWRWTLEVCGGRDGNDDSFAAAAAAVPDDSGGGAVDGLLSPRRF